MSTNITPTTLGNLEFTDIKKSLTEFLKTQSVFSGYNFNGSAIQSMIDLMAYNTFYYAYYANMINAEAFLDSAQREDSMISLCKPLGFAVPSRSSASALIQVSALPNNDTIPAGFRFISTNSNGVPFSFYTLSDIPVVQNGTEPFRVFEASRYVEFDAIPTFDFNNQRISIAADGFDLSTIQVTVTERIDETTNLTQIWTPVQNIGYTSRVDENIYFVERTSTGFSIVFGSANSVGRSIDDSIQRIIVRYLITNGSAANGLVLFSNVLGGIVSLVSPETSGGRDSPDLDEVRFLAPKWFAAQERAVTVNDYKALLLQSGFFNNQFEFNVYGGQDLKPPKYGRVFITSNLQPTDQKISDMINFLKERSVVTILPEYATAKALSVYADFSFGLGIGTPNTDSKRSSLLSTVKSLFQTNFGKVAQFNVNFSASDFVELLRRQDNSEIKTLIISPENFDIYVKESLSSNTDYNFNLENQLYLPLNTRISITEPFTCDLVDVGTQAVLKMYVATSAQKNTFRELELWQRSVDGSETLVSTTSSVGRFNAIAGVIQIPKNIIKTNAVLNVLFERKSFVFKTENLVTFTYGDVRII